MIDDKLIRYAMFTSRLSYESMEWLFDNLYKESDSKDFIKDIITFLYDNNICVNIINLEKEYKPNIAITIFDNNIFISFSGLRNNFDLYHCLNYYLTYSEELDLFLHRGFYNLYKRIKKNIDDLIKYYESIMPEKNIIFTGHSLGGAIAKIVTLYYNLNGKDYTCITFATPKPGDCLFEKKFNEYVTKEISICAGTDFISLQPFCRRKCNTHEYMFDRFGEYQLIPCTYNCRSYLWNLITFNCDTHKLSDFYTKNKIRLEKII